MKASTFLSPWGDSLTSAPFMSPQCLRQGPSSAAWSSKPCRFMPASSPGLVHPSTPHPPLQLPRMPGLTHRGAEQLWPGVPCTARAWNQQPFLFFFFYNCIYFFYFWLHWVFVVVRGLSLVVASGGYSWLPCKDFSLRWLLLLRSTGSKRTGFSSCGPWA